MSEWDTLMCWFHGCYHGGYTCVSTCLAQLADGPAPRALACRTLPCDSVGSAWIQEDQVDNGLIACRPRWSQPVLVQWDWSVNTHSPPSHTQGNTPTPTPTPLTYRRKLLKAFTWHLFLALCCSGVQKPRAGLAALCMCLSFSIGLIPYETPSASQQ